MLQDELVYLFHLGHCFRLNLLTVKDLVILLFVSTDQIVNNLSICNLVQSVTYLLAESLYLFDSFHNCLTVPLDLFVLRDKLIKSLFCFDQFILFFNLFVVVVEHRNKAVYVANYLFFKLLEGLLVVRVVACFVV